MKADRNLTNPVRLSFIPPALSYAAAAYVGKVIPARRCS